MWGKKGDSHKARCPPKHDRNRRAWLGRHGRKGGRHGTRRHGVVAGMPPQWHHHQTNPVPSSIPLHQGHGHTEDEHNGGEWGRRIGWHHTHRQGRMKLQAGRHGTGIQAGWDKGKIPINCHGIMGAQQRQNNTRTECSEFGGREFCCRREDHGENGMLQ